MLHDFNLKTLWVPHLNLKRLGSYNLENFEYVESIPQADIYVSPNFLNRNKKLLCLIQGTGTVRAG